MGYVAIKESRENKENETQEDKDSKNSMAKNVGIAFGVIFGIIAVIVSIVFIVKLKYKKDDNGDYKYFTNRNR